MSLQPIAVGLVATALAALQLVAWVALGSVFVASERESRIALPVAVMIGVGITGCVYALFAWAGLVHLSIVVVPAACVVAIALRFAHTRRLLTDVLAMYVRMWDGRRWARRLTVGAIAFLWLITITPPRDADVMRYHLAKMRLFDLEGIWAPILHWNHSNPFGWSVNYLPFEHLGIPQGGHVLNLGLLIFAIGITSDVLRRLGTSAGLMALLCSLFVLQPWVLKVSTTGYVDMHLHFAMLAVAAIVCEDEKLDLRRLAFLGFVPLVSTQAHYQAVLVSLTVSLLLLYWGARRRVGLEGLVAFGLGGMAGLALAAPYYVYNFFVFDNPFWPLMVPQLNDLDIYANQVANAYQAEQAGTHTLETLVKSIGHVLMSVESLPVPAMAFGLVGVAALRGTHFGARALGLLVGLFFLIYFLFNPSFYPRYTTFLTAWVIVGWAPVLTQWSVFPQAARGIRIAIATLLVALLGQASWYSVDLLRYTFTGDAAAYHEYTPFWAVYDWVNRETPEDSRHVVVVTSGHAYYLNRVFRQADPSLSGEVDWPSLDTPDDLDRVLAAGDFDYLIYEDRNWSVDVGGAHMSDLVDATVRSGVLRPLARIDTKLYLSRVLRRTTPVVVYVLERTRGPMAGRVSASVAWRADRGE